MREFLSNCVIGRVPQLRQTLIKYNNMSIDEINALKKNIIANLNTNDEKMKKENAESK